MLRQNRLRGEYFGNYEQLPLSKTWYFLIMLHYPFSPSVITCFWAEKMKQKASNCEQDRWLKHPRLYYSLLPLDMAGLAQFICRQKRESRITPTTNSYDDDDVVVKRTCMNVTHSVYLLFISRLKVNFSPLPLLMISKRSLTLSKSFYLSLEFHSWMKFIVLNGSLTRGRQKGGWIELHVIQFGVSQVEMSSCFGGH